MFWLGRDGSCGVTEAPLLIPLMVEVTLTIILGKPAKHLNRHRAPGAAIYDLNCRLMIIYRSVKQIVLITGVSIEG